jgi:3-hydroxy-3-methylglutaryl CoA synthase
MKMAANEANDIGIIGMEAYFPRYFVEQKELGKLKQTKI